MESLENKLAVVTGASQGIGKGIAIALAKQSCKIILASRDEEKMNAVAAEISAAGGRAQVCVCDITDEGAVDGLFKLVAEHKQGLDILVNNAGMAISGRIDELSYESWRQVQDVNVNGMFLCCRGAARLMKPAKKGRIINIGSISGQMPRVKSSPYTTSKFAVAGLTKALALELRAYNIAVCCINPGNVMTDIWEKSPQVPEKEGVMAVEDLAELVVTMASLPDHVNLFESVILPVTQPYLGRG